MRIVFVVYSLTGGGAERVTTILSQHWAKAGHTVRVMTFAEETANFYKLGPDVEYQSLHCPAIGSNLLATIFLNFFRMFVLRRALNAFQPDAVIGIMATTSALVALSCVGLPCKTVGTEHTYPLRAPLPPFQQFVRGISYRLLDAVVVLTSEAEQWIKAHTWARTVHVIPNPVNWPLEALDPFLSPDDICLPGRSILLAVGRLVPEKGFIRLVEAFAKIATDNPLWDLVILGAGPEQIALEQRRDKLNLGRRIFFPGRAGNVGDWYGRASIFAMSSLIEGFPNVLLEAMASGLPAISTDCDTGPRDLIQNNVNGLLVPQDDSVALAEGLRALMASDSFRSRLAEKAREVTSIYGVEQISRQWEIVIDLTRSHRRL